KPCLPSPCGPCGPWCVSPCCWGPCCCGLDWWLVWWFYHHPCCCCSPWVPYGYPTWVVLPGIWVDVPVVAVEGLDLQLLAVRFVDSGSTKDKLGDRYRVWLRNSSAVAIRQPFNVLLMAANSPEPSAGLPQAGVRLSEIEAGQILSVDIRLPYEASIMGKNASGQPAPFSHLHVLVDSHREVADVFRANNGAVLARGDILPVDPLAFEIQPASAAAGAVVIVTGEGFGAEPGTVLVP